MRLSGRRLRLHATGRLSAAILVGLGLAAAERTARTRLSDQTGAKDLDVDATGLSAHDVAVEHGRFRLEAARLHLGPWTDGLGVTVTGGRVAVRDRPPGRRGAPAGGDGSARRAHDEAAAPASHGPPALSAARRILDRLGLSIGLAVTDLDLEGIAPGPVSDAHVHALSLRRASGGTIDLRALGRLEPAGLPALDVRLRAHKVPAAPGVFSGAARFEDAPRLAASGTFDGATLSADVQTGAHGSAHLAASRDGGVTLSLDDAALAPLAPLVRAIVGRALGVEAARVSGRVHAAWAGHDLRIELAPLSVNGLRVEHPRVSDAPLTLDALTLDAVARTGPTGRSLAGTVSHGPITVEVSARQRARHLRAFALLPPTPCQTLLDGAPRALVPHLAGASFAGTLAGSFDLDLPLDAVGSVPEGPTPSDPPGRLRVELPFSTSCVMTTPPPGVDVAGLNGPYVHRFRGDDGRLRRRVLAPGEDGYVPLDRARLTAAALVTMEDTRFWEHDGFDRKQMERAFWHNLLRGRIERGASTITQQLARNLWLGGDRTLARKLEEAVLAAHLEQVVDKRRILEAYINVIELGPEVYGVEDAAHYHFGRSARRLEVLEALYLASLAPAPRALSARHHANGIPPAWIDRLRTQARRMALHGFLSWDAYRAAIRRTVRLAARSAG